MSLSNITSFFAGFLVRGQCGNLPCSAKWRTRGPSRTVRLTIRLVSLEVEGLQGGGLVSGTHPFVKLESDEVEAKQSCLGEWSADEKRWLFNEQLTFDVTPRDQFLVTAFAQTEYSLGQLQFSWNANNIGSANVDLATKVLPNLIPSDPNLDDCYQTAPGFRTPNLVFSLRDSAQKQAGQITICFETNHLPTADQPAPWLGSVPWLVGADCGMCAADCDKVCASDGYDEDGPTPRRSYRATPVFSAGSPHPRHQPQDSPSPSSSGTTAMPYSYRGSSPPGRSPVKTSPPVYSSGGANTNRKRQQGLPLGDCDLFPVK